MMMMCEGATSHHACGFVASNSTDGVAMLARFFKNPAILIGQFVSDPL
jgi:hypothetical protein